MTGTGGQPDPERPTGEPGFRELFGEAVRGAGIAKVEPGQIPTASSLLAAVGGVRGLVEAILPGLGFLVLYTTTRDLLLSVVIPIVIALGFVVARLIARTSLTGALAGVVGVVVSAALALFTGRPEDNFIPGIVINSVWLVALLISLAVRYPLIGVVVGVLANDGLEWRRDAAKRRVLTLATLLWVGLFGIRLAVELPLYFARETELLAGAKLVLGVPFYAGVLWVTWLLVRTVYGRPASEGASEGGDAPRGAPRVR
ncbi:MAG: hypothetical protein RI885_1796 [Actinomycetota bacterium]